MKRNSFNVLFFIKKAKLLKNGEASVCMRITVNGERVENNIRMSIEPVQWNQAKECAKGKSRKACELNLYIEQAKIKLRKLFDEQEERNHPVSARILQEKFFGINEEVKEVRTIIGTMQEHNDQCRELVGKDYALITVRRYESCKRYLAELIRLKYYKEDLPLSEVNGELVRAFEFYLKTEKECQQNTVIRYMKCLKKITNLALANEWITKDPFIGIKFHEKEVIREFLTLDELHRIYMTKLNIDASSVNRSFFFLLCHCCRKHGADGKLRSFKKIRLPSVCRRNGSRQPASFRCRIHGRGFFHPTGYKLSVLRCGSPEASGGSPSTVPTPPCR